MADEDKKPLERLSLVEKAPEPPVEMSAIERLRAFEDKVMGKKVPRVNGAVERGHGSKHAQLEDHHKAHHAALERLVDLEDEVMKLTASLNQAKANHEQQIKIVDGHAERDE